MDPSGFDRAGLLRGLRGAPQHKDLPDQPELYGVRDTRAADAWAELLAREQWQWFATLTFRRDHQRASGGMHPEKADKCFRYWIRCINERLYGPRWLSSKRAQGGVCWARGQEFHKDGKVHFHAVLGAPDQDLNRTLNRYEFHELWFREFGRNQIEPPRSQDDVLSYVSKYVTKDGEVDVSRNFGAARPLRMFSADARVWRAVESQAHGATGIGRLGGQDEAPAPAARGRGFLSLTPELRPEETQFDLPRIAAISHDDEESHDHDDD